MLLVFALMALAWWGSKALGWETIHRQAAVLAVPLVADYGWGDNWDASHQASGHASS